MKLKRIKAKISEHDLALVMEVTYPYLIELELGMSPFYCQMKTRYNKALKAILAARR